MKNVLGIIAITITHDPERPRETCIGCEIQFDVKGSKDVGVLGIAATSLAHKLLTCSPNGYQERFDLFLESLRMLKDK